MSIERCETCLGIILPEDSRPRLRGLCVACSKSFDGSDPDAGLHEQRAIGLPDRLPELADIERFIVVGFCALYPVLSDDGTRMWASRPEPECTALDVVYDSDESVLDAALDTRAAFRLNCSALPGRDSKSHE